MELIKRKILLECGISRKLDNTYGLITASTFNFNIFLTQDMDDMGLYTDLEYYDEVPNYIKLIDKLNNNGFTFPFMGGATPPSTTLNGFTKCYRHDNALVSDWYEVGSSISATTSSRLNHLKSYDKTNRFITNFDINTETYVDYMGNTINGVSRITKIINNVTGSTEYVFDANNDLNIGTENQVTGFRFVDSPLVSRSNISNLYYIGEGWSQYNTSLSALTKQEYLFGIINEPEIFNDVFIDRGSTTIMEKHLKLSEVESLEHLKIFGNGFYKITKT